MQDQEHTFKPWNQQSPRRRFRRWMVDLPATVLLGDGRRLACRVFDVSPGGARLQFREGEPPRPGTQIELAVDGYGTIPAEVRHGTAGIVGLMFLHDEADEVDFARFLIEVRPERPQTRRALELAATLRLFADDLPCTVSNLSSTGAQLTLPDRRELAVGDRVELLLPGYGAVPATIRHVDGKVVGLALSEGLNLAQLGLGPDGEPARAPVGMRRRAGQ
jgi:hypothetical protein